MNIKIKLDNLKKEHYSLYKEYGEIYVDGSSEEEREMVVKMRKIEETFRMLDLNVYHYRVVI